MPIFAILALSPHLARKIMSHHLPWAHQVLNFEIWNLIKEYTERSNQTDTVILDAQGSLGKCINQLTHGPRKSGRKERSEV